MVRTLIRNGDWKNEDRFWLAVERTAPYDPQIKNILGFQSSQRGDI